MCFPTFVRRCRKLDTLECEAESTTWCELAGNQVFNRENSSAARNRGWLTLFLLSLSPSFSVFKLDIGESRPLPQIAKLKPIPKTVSSSLVCVTNDVVRKPWQTN